MFRRSALMVFFVTYFAVDASAEDQVKLRVIVTDEADTAPLLLAAAQGQAARILTAGGVKTSWKVCSSATLRPGGPSCAEPGVPTVRVRILPSEKAKAWPLNPQSCGLALTGSEGERGFLAIVDEGCAARMSRFKAESRAAVLGHVIAHEVGHLLLGSNSHSASGLMRGQWTADEQALLVRGQLHFSREESEKLREAMRAREAAAQDDRFPAASKSATGNY